MPNKKFDAIILMVGHTFFMEFDLFSLKKKILQSFTMLREFLKKEFVDGRL